MSEQAFINGPLIIYNDGMAIPCTTESSLVWEPKTSLTEGQKEWTFTTEGHTRIDDYLNDPETKKMYAERMFWRTLQNMPRKKKKRIKMLIRKGATINITLL